jgi:hypothetical protein
LAVPGEIITVLARSVGYQRFRGVSFSGSPALDSAIVFADAKQVPRPIHHFIIHISVAVLRNAILVCRVQKCSFECRVVHTNRGGLNAPFGSIEGFVGIRLGIVKQAFERRNLRTPGRQVLIGYDRTVELAANT